MTRMTRMIYVEEISDSEREHVDKTTTHSIEMKTKVTRERAVSTSSGGDGAATSGGDKGPSDGDISQGASPSGSGSGGKDANCIGLAENKGVSSDLPEVVGEDTDSTTLPDMQEISIPHIRSRRLSQTPLPDLTRARPNKTSPISKTPKTLHMEDELVTIEDSMLYKTLSLLMTFMKIAGLFFIRRKRSHHGGFRGFWVNCTPMQAYCIAMNILLALNFARSLIMLQGTIAIDSAFFFNVLVIIFFYEAMSRAMLNFVACWKKKKGIQELFKTLDDICYPDGIIPYEESLRTTVKAMLGLSFVITFANMAVLVYGFFGPDSVKEVFKVYLIPVKPGSSGALILEITLLFITFVNSMVAMLSLTFFTLICYVMHKEFEYFTRMFVMKIGQDDRFLDDLERFRIRHQRRCKVVDDADQIFKYYIANTYLTNVPLLCLLLYSVVYVDDVNHEFSMRMIGIYRLGYVFLQMMVLSVFSTMINTQVRVKGQDLRSRSKVKVKVQGQRSKVNADLKDILICVGGEIDYYMTDSQAANIIRRCIYR